MLLPLLQVAVAVVVREVFLVTGNFVWVSHMHAMHVKTFVHVFSVVHVHAHVHVHIHVHGLVHGLVLVLVTVVGCVPWVACIRPAAP